MAARTVRIIMHGVTGRMGTNQHLVKSVLAIRNEGGLILDDGDRLIPEPVLVGRNASKLKQLAERFNIRDWTTDLDTTLSDRNNKIFFDAASTDLRPGLVLRALEAGKHIYCEKPIAHNLDQAMQLVRMAASKGLKNGVVQDKLFLPGLTKLRLLCETGFFGRILHVRLDFGWWIFDGEHQPAQRSSWNYRRARGGGLVLDMYPHWRYIVDRLFGTITSVSCRYATRIPRRWDESGKPYDADVEDVAYAIFELENGLLVEVSSSWCTRVRRDDLLTIHVDGTNGSAVTGLHHCVVQPHAATPKPIWDIEIDRRVDYRTHWQEVPDTVPYQHSFRAGWERFLLHVERNEPFEATLLEGAKGVQLAEACYRSHQERRWIDLPKLEI